jgi:hypothetical protein
METFIFFYVCEYGNVMKTKKKANTCVAAAAVGVGKGRKGEYIQPAVPLNVVWGEHEHFFMFRAYVLSWPPQREGIHATPRPKCFPVEVEEWASQWRPVSEVRHAWVVI